MDRLEPGIEAELFLRLDLGRGGAALLAAGDERGDLGAVGGVGLRDRVIGRDRDEAGTEDRVGARREYLDPFGATGDLEPEGQPTAPPDPVLLHQLDLVGPVIERLPPLPQFTGEQTGRTS